MNEKFSGQDLETGILQRVRSWSDLFPVLVLLRALRVCGSPIYVSLSLIAWLLWMATITGGQIEPALKNLDVTRPFQQLRLLADVVFAAQTTWPSYRFVGVVIASFIVLLPLVLLIRAGGLCAAGREPGGITDAAKFVSKRFGSLLISTLLPLVCIVGLAVPLLLLALSDRVPVIGDYLAELLSIFVAPLLIMLGMIAAGSAVAVPVAWATIAIEKKQDPFDALSRGYEYVYRRPVQCLVYILSSGLLAEFISAITRAICAASLFISFYFYGLVSGGEELPLVIRMVLTHLPHATWLAAICALLGATYLLLRKSANQQEIEDIAVSPIDTRKSELPSLRGGVS